MKEAPQLRKVMQDHNSAEGRRSEQSIRLFRNPVLEAMSRVHPSVPLLVWTPFVLFLMGRAVMVHNMSIIVIGAMAVAGLITWTLTEYLLHRFLFHYPAKSRLGRWLVFLFHGVHHDAPRDRTRLVMPPAAAVLILACLWFLFSLFIPYPLIEPFIAAFVVGYLIYDYIHYATHHFPMKHPVLRFLKRYHMHHHYTSDEGRFGVSSPLWDIVFGTYPRQQSARRTDRG